MGLFSSREDNIKKLDEKLADFDDEYMYKKLLNWLEQNADSSSTDFDKLAIAYILHHDIVENTKKLEELKKAIEAK